MTTTAEQPLGELTAPRAVTPGAVAAGPTLERPDVRAAAAVAVGLAIGAVAHALASTVLPPVPCAARPSTGFVHRDGACRCFVGGPAPEFPRAADPGAQRPDPGTGAAGGPTGRAG